MRGISCSQIAPCTELENLHWTHGPCEEDAQLLLAVHKFQLEFVPWERESQSVSAECQCAVSSVSVSVSTSTCSVQRCH